MSWRRIGRLVVTVHTDAAPDDEEWAGYVALVRDRLPPETHRVLVVSAGGGPNIKQRKMMVDALNGSRVPVAILSSSLVMRGTGIAISWFNPSLKVFGPEAFDAAVEHLGLTPSERVESARVIRELEVGLGLRTIPPFESSEQPSEGLRKSRD